MIELIIRNFKCFFDIKVPLNNLTILAGGNGKGKSTVIQALLLLRRTIEHCGEWKLNHFEYTSINNLNVELNGVYCLGLGSSLNILPANFEQTDLELGLSSNDNKILIQYSTNNLNELWITPHKLSQLDFHFPENPLMFQQFYYLNAERIGPRINQEMKFYDYANVGHRGEFTAQTLADLDSLESDSEFRLDPARILNDPKYLAGNKFQHHVNAWLSFILGGITIIPIKDSNTHTARIAVENKRLGGTQILPTNTGFGISYSLPIIVSCLLAKKDAFVVIENPEAHLHPSAQSRMGYFLGVMSNAGIRLIAETHSDHIVNGIQIAVAEKKVPNESVTINFFNYDEQSKQPELQSIQLTEKGELTDWPQGFFDQAQIDYAHLTFLRKDV